MPDMGVVSRARKEDLNRRVRYQVRGPVGYVRSLNTPKADGGPQRAPGSGAPWPTSTAPPPPAADLTRDHPAPPTHPPGQLHPQLSRRRSL